MICLEIFVILWNALLFPAHLMCTRHSISERLRTYLWFQPCRFCEIHFILQVLLYTFNSLYQSSACEFVYVWKWSLQKCLDSQSHLHVKLFRKLCVWRFASGACMVTVNRGSNRFMSVCGNYGMPVAVTGCMWQPSSKRHIYP